MRAAIGDTLHIHTNHLGTVEDLAEILEVRGSDGAPPYLVQFKDGRKRLLFPGPDAVIESSTAAEVEQRAGRRIHTRPGW
jgi:hypothetical protein